VIVPIVQSETRHHLAVENEREGIASVEVIYHEPEYGRVVLVYVTLDNPEDTEVRCQVKAS
jgi:hypothetical protein